MTKSTRRKPEVTDLGLIGCAKEEAIQTTTKSAYSMQKLEIDSSTILGSGGFAIVFRGYLVDDAVRPAKRRKRDNPSHFEEGAHNSKSIPVAVKRIQLAHIKSRDGEEEALRQLDHPNIMKLFHVESDEHFR